MKLVAETEGSSCPSNLCISVRVPFLVISWVTYAPSLNEGSIKNRINFFGPVPFQEINHFFLDYSGEFVVSDSADEPAENASRICCLLFLYQAQFSKSQISIKQPSHLSQAANTPHSHDNECSEKP